MPIPEVDHETMRVETEVTIEWNIENAAFWEIWKKM